MNSRKIIIDAKDATVGRLASYAAKQALLGKEIIIVNCNEALIIGNPDNIIKEYNEARKRGGSSLHGPFFPKSPERIVKRTIRGMLTHRQGRGSDAFGRIRCYNATPEEYKNESKIESKRKGNGKSIKLEELKKLM